MKLAEMDPGKIEVDDLPFVKRFAFEPENELRVTWESANVKRSTLDFPISLACINKITLSPWMHRNLQHDTTKLLKSITGCSDLHIVRSTLIGNDDWKKAGEAVCSRKSAHKRVPPA